MPYNGSGGFTRVRNWVADAAAKIKIKSDFHDQEDDNFASGLSNVICKDGQTTITADIPFNGKKITNVAAPTNPTDAATKGYVDTSITNTAVTNIIPKLINTSQTWTKPAGLKYLRLEGVGAGGQGGGAPGPAASQASAGSGGGSGGSILALIKASDLPASVSITMGAGGSGGAAGAAGNPGGTTTFGSLITLGGGGNGAISLQGVANQTGQGGAAGTVTTTLADAFPCAGTPGGTGWMQPAVTGTTIGGYGAPSGYGGGARGATNPSNGNAGNGAGSGGAGASRWGAADGAGSGGAGALGAFWLWEIY